MYGPNYGNTNPTTHRVEVQLPHLEKNMGVDDKVEVKNIFQPGGGHSGGDGVGGLGAMAAIAALGNRNDNGHRGYGGDGLLGGGLGAGLLGGVLAGALFGGRGLGGGFGGNGGSDSVAVAADINQSIFGTAVLTKLGSIEAAVPLSALQTQASINGSLASLALGTQQGFSNVKDSVQNVGAALGVAIAQTNTNVLTTGCAIERQITNDGAATRALITSIFQTQQAERINALNAEVIELRNDGRARANHDELRLQITNTNTAVAAQAQGQQQQQQQQQFALVQSLFPVINALVGDLQAVKQGQVIFNSGTMAASGTQAAANTKVA